MGLGLSIDVGLGSWRGGGGGGVAAATLNPTTGVNKYSGITLTNGNLTATPDGGGSYEFDRATRPANSGATQFEATVVNNSNFVISVEDGSQDFSVAVAAAGIPGNSGTTGISFDYISGNGFIYILYNGVAQNPACTINNGDKLTVQMDRTASTVKLLLNGTQLGTTVTVTNWANWYAAGPGKSALTFNFAGSFSFGTNAAY